MKKRALILISMLLAIAAGTFLVTQSGRRSGPLAPAQAAAQPMTAQAAVDGGSAVITSNDAANTVGRSQASQAAPSPYSAALRSVSHSRRAWDAGFLETLEGSSIGDPVRFELTDGQFAAGIIRITQQRDGALVYVSGELTEPEAGKFFFIKPPEGGKAGKAVGVIEFPSSEVAYRIEPTGLNGEPELWKRRLDEVLCVGLPKPVAAATTTNAPLEAARVRPEGEPMYVPAYNTNVNGVAIVSLQSNPGAKAVYLLDFFGGSTPSWGGINYSAPAGVDNASIKDVWKRVAEDYMPFNINVTTDIRVYQAAPISSRQRCCFTDTPVTAAGVAYFGSWNWGSDTPCWSVYNSGKNGAEVASHEGGHTLGLSHDTQEIPTAEGVTHVEYFGGHGQGETGWAPTMGVGYGQLVSTWSKGEYQHAGNLEDDLAVILNNNNVAYRSDDAGHTLAASRHLDVYPDYTISAEGIIGHTDDSDAFQFTTTGGQAHLLVSPAGDWACLGLSAVLLNANGAVIATANNQTTLSAAISAYLPAGTYLFRVTGAGRNDPATSGFSSYASLGYYSIQGSIAGARQTDRFELMEFAPLNTKVGTVSPLATGGPFVFSIVSGNSNNTFSIDSTGTLRVANNALLNYDSLALSNPRLIGFELFVNITNLNDPAATELRRVVVDVLDSTARHPIQITGFNAGLIVPYNATVSNPGATAFDVPNKWCFYQSGMNGNPYVGGSGATLGFPRNGKFASLEDHTIFRFGPYGGLNALMLGAGYSASGTLTFTEPRAYNSLAILAASANGGGQGTCVIHFADGSRSPALKFNAQDWFFNTQNVALSGFGRLRLGQSTLWIEHSGFDDPNLYQTTIDLAAMGLNREIVSISFTNVQAGANQSCAIFAISGLAMPPQLTITAQPQSVTNSNPSQGAVFTAAAMGAPPLSWQWYFSPSGAPGTFNLLSGQVSSTLTRPPELLATDAGYYCAVVTGSSTSVTSAPARLTLVRAPAITRQLAPADLRLFAGQERALSIEAHGAVPLTFHWKKNGSPFKVGSSPSLYLPALNVSDSGTYSVIVSNAYGTSASSTIALTVVDAPTNTPYAGGILAERPIGFWRLGETSGLTAYDSVGGNNGVYVNAALNQPGFRVQDPDKAAAFGPGINSYVGQVPIDFSTNANRSFSIEAWVKGGPQTTDAGIVTRGTGGGGEQFNLDTGGGGRAFRFFIRDSFGSAHLASGNVTPNNTWQHLVGVVDAETSRVILYVNGVSNASGSISVGNGILKTSSPMTIGSRQSGTGAFNNQFAGAIDEVAVYDYALSPAQVSSHYELAGLTQRPLVTLRTSDAAGTSSFTAGANWSDNATPSLLKRYFAGQGLTLRTPTTSGTIRFPGYSLALSNATLAIKAGNNSTIAFGNTPDSGLTLDNSTAAVWDDNRTETLAGYILLASAGGAFDPRNGLLTVSAQIGGSGAFKLESAYPGGVLLMTSRNSYLGGTVVNSASVLRLANSATLGSSTGSLQILNTAAKGFGGLDLNGLDLQIGNLSGTGGFITNRAAGETSTLTVGTGNAGSGSFAGLIADGAGKVALKKIGTGVITLSRANTYTGSTTVSEGTLALSGAGSIYNSRLVLVEASGTLDVLGRPDQTLSFSSGRKLTGDGTILGKLSAFYGSLLEPGVGIGTLTAARDITLAGTLVMEVSRASVPNCDRLVSTAGTITGGGNLVVTNLGVALQAGDSFQLFSTPVSGFTSVQLPPLVPGLRWSNTLAVDGAVRVESESATLTAVQSSPGALKLSWPGAPGWRLQAQTNLAGAGLTAQWFDVPQASGTNEVFLSIDPANGSVFFRLIQP